MKDLLDDNAIETMLTDANLVMRCPDNHHAITADLACHVVALATEREALIAALHAAQAHPDFSYLVGSMGGASAEWMAQGGWEPNPEYKAAPGYASWRRRKDT